jgi:hypothetical protein
MDVTASNYNPLALYDDGSCVPYDDLALSLCPQANMMHRVNIYLRGGLEVGVFYFTFVFAESLGEIAIAHIGEEGLAADHDIQVTHTQTEIVGIADGVATPIEPNEIADWTHLLTLQLSKVLSVPSDISFSVEDLIVTDASGSAEYIIEVFDDCPVEE